jgi:hypothetical protein
LGSRIWRPEIGLHGGEVKQDAAGEMQQGQHVLRGHQVVRDPTREEGRDHGADSRRSGHETRLHAIEVQRLAHPGGNGHIPCAPDEKFKKHHRGQTTFQKHSDSLQQNERS